MSPAFLHNPALMLPTLVVGLFIGSFLNVVIYRGPRLWDLVAGEARGSLAGPRSYCPACKKPIPFGGLIPLLSYIVLRGRCGACAAPISFRYPVVEALGAACALASLAAFGPTPAALAAAIFGWALIALAAIDLETGYLPDAITIPLITLGLVVNAFALFAAPADALIGAAAGFVTFWAIGRAFEKLRGKEGLGLGDAKLLAAAGAWGGWIILPFVVFVGAAATLLAIGLARTFGKRAALDQPVPFGPGLCAAAFAALAAAPRFLIGP
ncbi:MAG: prepilin peptidase [Parvularculaceae bacterium]|nr:prepilin peptidase [Parvularculaceae bacterium]